MSGRNLAQTCREVYPKPVIYTLWIIAEITVIASDIPEVVGTAIALKLLFGIELWIGVIITAASVIVFLGLSYFGVRKVEVFIGLLLGIIWVCFLAEFFMSDVDGGELMGGFIPNMSNSALYPAVGLVGAVIMPHNLFLHSALVQSRNVKRTEGDIREANLYNTLESGFALFISFTINVAVVAGMFSFLSVVLPLSLFSFFLYFFLSFFLFSLSFFRSFFLPLFPSLHHLFLLLHTVAPSPNSRCHFPQGQQGCPHSLECP